MIRVKIIPAQQLLHSWGDNQCNDVPKQPAMERSLYSSLHFTYTLALFIYICMYIILYYIWTEIKYDCIHDGLYNIYKESFDPYFVTAQIWLDGRELESNSRGTWQCATVTRHQQWRDTSSDVTPKVTWHQQWRDTSSDEKCREWLSEAVLGFEDRHYSVG